MNELVQNYIKEYASDKFDINHVSSYINMFFWIDHVMQEDFKINKHEYIYFKEVFDAVGNIFGFTMIYLHL